MSDDNFLNRWSRRKAAAKAEPPAEAVREEAKQAGPQIQPVPPPEPAADEVDLSALPPLDSITSVTDITAFLKRGVPEALRTAALRKAWTSDPAIRDFIGLSENAWDFNDPAGIPGFGPLEMSADQVRQMAAKLVGEVQEAAETIESALGPPAPQHEAPEPAPSADEIANPSNDFVASQQNESAAVQQTASAATESRPPRRGHGGALPR